MREVFDGIKNILHPEEAADRGRLEGRTVRIQPTGSQAVSAALLKSINISGEIARLRTLLLTPQAKFCT